MAVFRDSVAPEVKTTLEESFMLNSLASFSLQEKTIFAAFRADLYPALPALAPVCFR
jgi:hypothetical protein